MTLRHRLARIHPFVWIGVAAVAGGLIALPLGGWDTVVLESTKIPEVRPGTLVDGQQFAVEVDAAEVTAVHPDGFSEPDPGWEYFILTATVTNMTAETELSLYLGDNTFGIVTIDDGVVGYGSTLTGADGYDVSGDAYLIADDTFLPDLQPRLAAPITIVWPVPVGTWSVGDRITVGIVDRSPYEQTLSTGIGYRDPTVVATVELTVEGAS